MKAEMYKTDSAVVLSEAQLLTVRGGGDDGGITIMKGETVCVMNSICFKCQKCDNCSKCENCGLKGYKCGIEVKNISDC